MHKFFQRVLLVVVTALVSCGSSYAEDQSDRLRLAREVIVENETIRQFDVMLPIIKTMRPMLTQSNPKIERDFDQITNLIVTEFEPFKSRLADDIARLMAERYTKAELEELIRFFKSPTGRKMVQSTPAFAQDVMAVGQKYGKELGENMADRMKVELRKRGHNI
jgi:uncharacterized protein